MVATDDMVAVASAMASRARINMLEALAGGIARSATDLAAIADIQGNTASTHLQVLCKANLVKVVKQGRYRYYKIRDQSVSDLIELLGEQPSVQYSQKNEKPARGQCHKHSIPSSEMAFARTCYDHLAGWLGVQLSENLRANHYLSLCDKSFELTPSGEDFLAQLGVDLNNIKATRRVFARACQDWSEGELHIGGALGAQLFHFFIDQKWLAKNDDYREIAVLKKGERLLLAHFDIDVRNR